MKTRDEIIQFLQTQDLEIFQGFKDYHIGQYIFKRNSGLRLTRKGNMILGKYLVNYKYPHEYHFKAKHLIQITREFKYPYYIGLKQMVVFSEEDALMIKLCGGIVPFLDNLSQ